MNGDAFSVALIFIEVFFFLFIYDLFTKAWCRMKNGFSILFIYFFAFHLRHLKEYFVFIFV